MVAVAVFQMVKIDVPRPIVTAIATPPTSVKPPGLAHQAKAQLHIEPADLIGSTVLQRHVMPQAIIRPAGDGRRPQERRRRGRPVV